MSARDHITDILGQRVEVGDRVAVAVTNWRGTALVVGRVHKFTPARTSIRREAHSGYVFSEDNFSVIDDSRGNVVKIAEGVAA